MEGFSDLGTLAHNGRAMLFLLSLMQLLKVKKICVELSLQWRLGLWAASFAVLLGSNWAVKGGMSPGLAVICLANGLIVALGVIGGMSLNGNGRPADSTGEGQTEALVEALEEGLSEIEAIIQEEGQKWKP